MSEQRRAQAAERKWLDTYQPPARVSGRYIFPIDPRIYAGVGGFNKINVQYKVWRNADNES